MSLRQESDKDATSHVSRCVPLRVLAGSTPLAVPGSSGGGSVPLGVVTPWSGTSGSNRESGPPQEIEVDERGARSRLRAPKTRRSSKPQRRGLALTLARPRERVNSYASDVVALLFGALWAAFTLCYAFAAASLSA
jgi:hypothetical protein